MRQPIETGSALVARANHHVTYPARFQLVAAMNPCRCGYLGDSGRECTKAPRCGTDYQTKISGPLLDRMDIQVEVPAVQIADLDGPPGEPSALVALRVKAARDIQAARYGAIGLPAAILTNAEAPPEILEQVAVPEEAAKTLLNQAAATIKLSARGYHRVLRVARTIADLAGGPERLSVQHVAEALSYRRLGGL